MIRNNDALNFGSALVDGEHPGVAVVAFHRVFLGEPVAAVQLHRVGRDAVEREVRKRTSRLVDHDPGRVHDQPRRGRDAGQLRGPRAFAVLGSKLHEELFGSENPIGEYVRIGGDRYRVVGVLEQLRDSGNSLLVVEHDLLVVRASDWIVDLGPGAGEQGGEIVAAGTVDDIIRHPDSRRFDHRDNVFFPGCYPNSRSVCEFLLLPNHLWVSFAEVPK